MKARATKQEAESTKLFVSNLTNYSRINRKHKVQTICDGLK